MYNEDDVRTRHYKTIYVISLAKCVCLLVYRLAIRLPPYLLFTDVLDVVPPCYSIKPVVTFINSYLVGVTKSYTSRLTMSCLYKYECVQRLRRML